jgi:hypothetical protein
MAHITQAARPYWFHISEKKQQPLRSMDAAAHFIQLAIKYLLKLEV